MAKGEIITALKNAIERGETLEQAKQVLIFSGYNLNEIEEASKFVGSGTLNYTTPRSHEELVFPEKKKNFFSKIFHKKKSRFPQQLQQNKTPVQSQSQSQEIKNQIQNPLSAPENLNPQTQHPQIQSPQEYHPSYQSNQESFPSHFKPKPLTKQLESLQPFKKSRKKLIILLVLLLILIAGLLFLIIFKNTIFSWLGI